MGDNRTAAHRELRRIGRFGEAVAKAQVVAEVRSVPAHVFVVALAGGRVSRHKFPEVIFFLVLPIQMVAKVPVGFRNIRDFGIGQRQ
jgi:hypothetical protein